MDNRIIVAIAGIVLSLGLFTSAARAEQTLRITLQLPMNHHLGKNLQAFRDIVERDTDGEIEVEIYPSAQLYKDKEVPQAVGSGAIEMGVASITRFAGVIPAVDIFYVPFMFNSPELVAKATAPDSPIRRALDAEMTRTGARPLWWQAYGGAILLSKNKPIRRPEDMKDLKVRVFGKTLGEFAKAVGAAPALISGSEQFLAYQRGTVDAGMTGVTAVESRKLYQVMNYMTLTNHTDIEFVVLINEDVWRNLSDDHKAILTRAARTVERELRDKMVDIERRVTAELEDKINIIRLDPDDLEAWRAATDPVIDAYIRQAGPLGRTLVDEARKLREQ